MANPRAQGTPYFKGTVYEALTEAQRTHKMLIVEFYAPWNYKSRWTNQNIIPHPEIDKVIKEFFIISQVDTKTKDGAALALQYEITDYPAIVIFDVKGSVIDKITQTLDRTDFNSRLTQAMLENDGKSGWELRQIFSVAGQGQKEKASLMAMEYIDRIGKEQALLPVHWELWSNSAITYYGSSTLEYINKNRTYFDTAYSRVKMDELINNTYTDVIFPLAIGIYPYDSLYIEQFKQATDSLPHSYTYQHLAQLSEQRAKKQIDKYIKTLEAVVNYVNEELVTRLILSLDLVVTNGTAPQKQAARHIVEKYGRNTTSPSEIELISALTTRLSEGI